MLSLELESGFETAENPSSYFAYVEDKLREAEQKKSINTAKDSELIVVEYLKSTALTVNGAASK